jgi:hypothetical protein
MMHKKGNFFIIGTIIVFFIGILSVIVGISLQAQQFEDTLGTDTNQVTLLEAKAHKHHAFFELAAKDIFESTFESNEYGPFFSYLESEAFVTLNKGYVLTDYTVLTMNYDVWVESALNAEWRIYAQKYNAESIRLLNEKKFELRDSIPIGFPSKDYVFLYRDENAISGFAASAILLKEESATMYYVPRFTVDRTDAQTFLDSLLETKELFTTFLACIPADATFSSIELCAEEQSLVFNKESKSVFLEFEDVLLEFPIIHPSVDVLYEKLALENEEK